MRLSAASYEADVMKILERGGMGSWGREELCFQPVVVAEAQHSKGGPDDLIPRKAESFIKSLLCSFCSYKVFKFWTSWKQKYL